MNTNPTTKDCRGHREEWCDVTLELADCPDCSVHYGMRSVQFWSEGACPEDCVCFTCFAAWEAEVEAREAQVTS